MGNGFGKLYCEGKKLEFDHDTTIHEHRMEHCYLNDWFGWPHQDVGRKHGCLEMGYWCWKQAREEPFRALKFIFKKLCKDKSQKCTKIYERFTGTRFNPPQGKGL